MIDWKNPQKNDFAIAEEVTIKGQHSKRPDIVIYINGIAVGVLELKRSTVCVSTGIRQNNDNQKHLFIKPFYTTINSFVLSFARTFKLLSCGTEVLMIFKKAANPYK